jgi:hypothetical protein
VNGGKGEIKGSHQNLLQFLQISVMCVDTLSIADLHLSCFFG